jgi:hypothetical protein
VNSDQVFSINVQYAQFWIEVPFYIKSGNDSIRKIIGVDAKAKTAHSLLLFLMKGSYKLSPYLDAA